MKYTNEAEIMRALGIDSWRNLSREKVTRFAAMMPDMDKEVALKIVGQFPVFKDFALAVAETLERNQLAAVEGNKHSQDQVHQAWREVRAALKKELDRENLTGDERRHVLELLMETARQETKKDAENKRFLAELMRYAGAAAVGFVTVGIVFLGGRVIGETGGSLVRESDERE